MKPSENDPDATVLQKLYPVLASVGDKLKIPSGPLAGESTIIRRCLTARKGVLFTMKYDDGRIKEWEWFD